MWVNDYLKKLSKQDLRNLRAICMINEVSKTGNYSIFFSALRHSVDKMIKEKLKQREVI